MKKYTKSGLTPTHPGEILRLGYVDEYKIRAETLADLLGIHKGHLSRILNARNPITAELAIKLELITGTEASHWLALQADYDMYMYEQDNAFKKYRTNLDRWNSKVESLSVEERRADVGLRKLVTDTCVLAKGFSGRGIKK